MKLRILLIAGVVAFALSTNANALTAEEAENFVNSMSAIEEFGKKMEAEGKNIDMTVDKSNSIENFAPYTEAVKQLKEKYEDNYDDLEDLVEDHNFDNPEEWAKTGDDVMRAHISLSMGKQSNIPEMTPEMMAMIPPAAAKQMKQARAMVESMANAPEEHKTIVRPLASKIDQNIK